MWKCLSYTFDPQQAHNVETTSIQRWFNVKTLNQCWIDVVSTSCARWVHIVLQNSSLAVHKLHISTFEPSHHTHLHNTAHPHLHIYTMWTCFISRFDPHCPVHLHIWSITSYTSPHCGASTPTYLQTVEVSRLHIWPTLPSTSPHLLYTNLHIFTYDPSHHTHLHNVALPHLHIYTMWKCLTSTFDPHYPPHLHIWSITSYTHLHIVALPHLHIYKMWKCLAFTFDPHCPPYIHICSTLTSIIPHSSHHIIRISTMRHFHTYISIQCGSVSSPHLIHIDPHLSTFGPLHHAYPHNTNTYISLSFGVSTVYPPWPPYLHSWSNTTSTFVPPHLHMSLFNEHGLSIFLSQLRSTQVRYRRAVIRPFVNNWQWVSCERNSSYSFWLIILKLHRCFGHGV